VNGLGEGSETPHRCTPRGLAHRHDETPAAERGAEPVCTRGGGEEVRVTPARGATCRAQCITEHPRGGGTKSEQAEDFASRRTKTHCVPFRGGGTFLPTMIQLYHPSEPVAPARWTVQHSSEISDPRTTGRSAQIPQLGPLASPYGAPGRGPPLYPPGPGVPP